MTMRISIDVHSLLNQLEIKTDVLKSIKPRWKRMYYKSVVNLITKGYQPDSSNSGNVFPFIESFHQLCEVEDWKRAWIILSLDIDNNNTTQLHSQLSYWGYYNQQIELYSRIVDRLPPDCQCICLMGLASGYSITGRNSISIKCYQQAG